MLDVAIAGTVDADEEQAQYALPFLGLQDLRSIESTEARRDVYLRRSMGPSAGRQAAAIDLAIAHQQERKSGMQGAMRSVAKFVPGISGGIALEQIWNQMRFAALIAALCGQNLEDGGTKSEVLKCILGTAADKAPGKMLKVLVKMIFKALFGAGAAVASAAHDHFNPSSFHFTDNCKSVFMAMQRELAMPSIALFSVPPRSDVVYPSFIPLLPPVHIRSMWRVLCEHKVQWEGRQLYAQLVTVHGDVLLLLYQDAPHPSTTSAFVRGPEAALVVFAGAAQDDSEDSLKISGLGGASLANSVWVISFTDPETGESYHDASSRASFQLDDVSPSKTWLEHIAQAIGSRPAVTGIQALRQRFLSADLWKQDGISALATVMKGNGLGEGVMGRVRLAHMMRELVRLANGDALDGDGFDGHGAMVIEDKGRALFSALESFEGAYSRTSTHLPGYCADRNGDISAPVSCSCWGIDFTSSISSPAFLTELEHQLLLGPLHEFSTVLFLQLPPKAPGTSHLLYLKLETHGLNGLHNTVMHTFGILGRVGVTTNDSGRGVGARKEHKNKEQISALKQVLDLATKAELRHLFSFHRELDVKKLPHPKLQMKEEGGWGFGDSWMSVRCAFEPRTSIFSYEKKKGYWQTCVVKRVTNDVGSQNSRKYRFDFIDSNLNRLALAAASKTEVDTWMHMVESSTAPHSSILLAPKRGMREMVLRKADSHGRSFISEVYEALRACDGLEAATAEAVFSAQGGLFRVNDTGRDHRKAGRQFRFGNEVVLVHTDLVQHC
jgi:hypothetical protein